MEKIIQELNKILIGKNEVTKDILVALLSGGHILIEDVPGVGKTTIAKGLSKVINAKFNRIQFTPDLMPSDILGISIFNPKTFDFELKVGPIMANIILADEINRSNPKTQSSLLEAMGEGQFTIDSTTLELNNPFIVIATQNPVEFEGTYPLPESQLDRFMLKITIGYPEPNEEVKLLGDYLNDNNDLMKFEVQYIIEAKEKVENIFVKDNIKKFILDIVNATRHNEGIILGASPRATIDLFKASKALAFINKRDYVIPKDVTDLAVKVLAHRIKLSNSLKYQNVRNEEIIANIVKGIEVKINEGENR
jgi:MoxR-like ATPase